MTSLATVRAIPPMNATSIGHVKRIEEIAAAQPQIDIPVEQFLHGGMYARKIRIPAGVMITGALIKLDTVLVVSGDAIVYVGEEFRHVCGFQVFAAAGNRKQIFIAKADTDLTMFFPTDAKTVKEAEEQFTDEFNMLQTRRG